MCVCVCVCVHTCMCVHACMCVRGAVVNIVHAPHRRIAEAKDTKESPYSEAKSDVLSELSRKAAIKEAKELANTTQQEYIRAEQKARVEEDTVRKVHQKQADAAMQVRREEEEEEEEEEVGGEGNMIKAGL